LNLPGEHRFPPGLRVSQAGERAILERIRRAVPTPPPTLFVGLGDDAAVATPDRGTLQVLTTDALVEGVHFDRRFSSASDIGAKALAVNISDVAAMGGAPRLALLSLMLPGDLLVDDVDGLIEGLLQMAGAFGVALAGGNITRSPGPLILDVTVVGSVKPRKILTRGGGRPGDAVYVTGTIGAGAAGFEWLRAHAGGAASQEAGMGECVARYRRPEPRARIGALLGRNRAASACMDTSDGLADAITQVCQASGTGATIDGSALPIHPAARAWFGDRDPVQAALAGGDDYELVFTVPRRTRGRLGAIGRESRGVPLTCIGELTQDPAIVVRRDGRTEPLPPGFVHF
jgi:thiamine-monophosphate kinase